MPLHNADIAAVFDEIADLLEIESANPFRIRAYRNAARIVGELGRDVPAMVAKGEDLTTLPGFGEKTEQRRSCRRRRPTAASTRSAWPGRSTRSTGSTPIPSAWTCSTATALRFGVGQARRGWLEAKDVLNTRPLRELRKLL
jgi:hypothetical protein